MKNAFVIVTLSGLLSACASVPAPLVQPAPPAVPVEAAPVADAVPVAATDSGEAEAEPADPRLPKVAMTSDLLYRLLKAELDFRNGNWQGPYITLMGAAQQTRDPRLARRAAEMAISTKQPGESMAAIRLWRELAPDSEEAAQYYLGLAIMGDKLDEAEKIFAKRLEEASPATRPVAMFQIQQYLLRARDKAAAAVVLERLVSPYRGTVEAHVVLAQSAFGRGDGAAAVAEARAAMALKPDSELAALALAQVTGDPVQVQAQLEAFVAAHPHAHEVRTALARMLVEQKQYEAARAHFLTMLKDQPEHLGTLYAMGIMSMQLNDAAGAEQYLGKFIDVQAARGEEEREPGKVILLLSQLAEERGDLAAAQRWLDKVDADDVHTHFAAQLRRAQLMGKQGDVEGARRLLDVLRADSPAEQAQVVLARGQILRDAGQVDAAYQVMEEGARRFPANADLLYDFALMAEKAGRLDVMEKTLRDVIAQAPDNHHAYNALGYSLAERNLRLDEALSLIDTALKMAPGDPFIMDSMGWVQYRLGHLDLAEDYLRKAYALRSDAEIAVHLGEVLWHKGQQADAQKLWREANAKDPKNDTLKSTLARLHTSL